MNIAKSIKWHYLIAILLFLVGASLQQETFQECGRAKCNAESAVKFKYNIGTVYRYRHSINVSLHLGNASTSSNLFIGSVVEVVFITPCEADLQIIESNIAQRIRSKYEAEYPDRLETEFKKNLNRYKLRFAFEDGRIKELCPHPEEPTWSLNIKRGILSMLQNTMKRFDVDHHTNELDVNGICDTRYRLHQARKTSLIIMKTKDFNSCTNRGKHLSIIQSTGYQSPRKHSTNGLLDSYVNCEIVIDHNIYQSVSCKESHRLKALSNRDAAVQTSIDSSLILIKERKEGEEEDNEGQKGEEDNENDDGDDGDDDDDDDDDDDKLKGLDYSNIVPTNLLYDHSLESPREKSNRNELRTSWDLLNRMCLLASSGHLEQQFSQVYTKLIHSARLLDYSQLSQLLARAETICPGGKKHILDALPFIGTGASLKVMRDSMLKKSIDKDRSEKWLTAMALAPRPDSSTVAALLPILELEDYMPNGHVTLVYSAVVRAFCQNNAAINKWRRTKSFFDDGDCLTIEGTGIEKFLKKLEKTISDGCGPRLHHASENAKTLEALKAIGNMGLETETLLEKLEECVKDAGGFLPMEIKIGAIEAHRRLPSCNDRRDKIFLKLYRNITLDPEIRIASYLQTMNCPDYNVIKIIKDTLKKEPVNQVGSFVWSHLTNLLTSSSPTRIEIQSLLSDRDLDNKFNSDARKYSRNYETSFFSEEYNIGGTFQSNVIFSSKSYIPRTLTFNISLDLFGESVHVFEATIRMEGMEYYAEKFFGPDGPLANEKISQHIMNFLRSLRSTDGTSNVWNDINRLPNVIDNNFDDPRLSISYKIFGNDIDFINLRGRDDIVNNLIALNPWTKIQKLFSGKEIRYDSTGMFLDSSYIVTSASGLPVRLDLTGSAACNVKLSGNLNADKFSENHQLQFIGNLAPSVSVDITGKMTIDAFYKNSAIKIRSNAYSSSAVRLKLDIKGMELIRLNVELPNRKLEVFSANTDILLVNGNGATSTEKSALTSLRHRPTYFANTTCSWPILERMIGLKFCIDYQFPNVTEITDASYILLNGPTFFRTYIIKADPTAQSYLFEYKWNASPTDSILKIAFDTPGSTIHREVSATLSFDAANRNVSLILRSAGNSLMAKGTYKRTDDEAMVDVGLNINGTKHLHGYMGYIRKKSHYGYTYSPKMYLGINGERIAQLQGTIRDIHKNNVSQCDIDLKFDTKRVKSRVMGYIMRKNTSITGNIKIEYQLQPMPKKETLQIEISLMNRSSKTLTHKEANLKIQSSAYPQLNAIINSWYQHALGHFEVHLEVNGKPHLKDDRHKLTAQLVLTHSKAYFQSDEAKINAYFSLTKPIQNLDIKIGIQKFSIGSSTKTFILVRYAPGKEITLAVNLIMPRGTMFAIEAHANMTIPTLKPLIIAIKITEKAKREYDIDFAGTWFSGHNITIRGTYADRSAIVASNFIAGAEVNTSTATQPHVVNYVTKLLVRSPSLERDILINCKLYRDFTDIDVDLNIEYLDADKYALKFQHSQIHFGHYISNAEIRYKHNVYAVSANIDMEREIRMEIHLDRWRDVHIALTAINQQLNKEFGIEIKWDANRDPDLKFATLVQLTKHYEETQRNLSAYLMVTYPGRLFTSSGLLALTNGNNYIADIKILWDPTSIVRVALDIDFDPNNWHNYAKFNGQILTPFIDWKETSLHAKYNWTDSNLSINCNAHWHDNETVSIQLMANSDELYPGMHQYNANCQLISTINNIGWMTIDLSHKVTNSNINNSIGMDSQLLVKYSPDKVVNIKTFWLIDGPANPHDNVTLIGNIHFASPLVNYQNGHIKVQLRWSQPNWTFEGASTVDIDLRKYTGILKGDLKRIKESMIAFNLTTPLEKYRFVTGRFGISERNRHIVGEIVSPAGPLGIEGLFQLFTADNFNVMFKLSTPIEFIQRLLLVAKLSKTEADFRLAYNNITAGFEAIWYYNNITDFHYSYIVYTPIHGLHESGVVAKLIIPDLNNDHSSSYKKQYIIDSEFSVRIVESKVGIQAKTGPTLTSETLKIFHNKNSQSIDDENDDFSWHGYAEINLAIIEPIIVNLDIDKNHIVYKINGVIHIPNGIIIIIDDKFSFEDVFHMNNILEITTPLSWANKLHSIYIFDVDMENSIYFMELEINVFKQIDMNNNNNNNNNDINNTSYWVESGFKGNYSYTEGDEDESQNHRLELTIKTPLDFLKIIHAIGVYESDENIYKSSIELKTNESIIYSNGTLELDPDDDNNNKFFEGIFFLGINSSIISIPMTKIGFKKDFTDKEKHIEAIIEISNETMKKLPCKIQIGWQIESSDNAQLSVNLETWMTSLPFVEIDLFYLNNLSKNQTFETKNRLKYYPNREYKLYSSYEPNGIIDMSLMIAPEDITYTFNGKFDEHTGQLMGELKNLKNLDTYRIDGQLDNTVEPSGDGKKITKMRIIFNETEENKIDVEIIKDNYGFKVIVNSNVADIIVANGSLSFNYRNAFNWDTSIGIIYPSRNEKSKLITYHLEVYTNVQVNGNASLYLRAESPLAELEHVETFGNLLIENDSGDARIKHQLNNDKYYLRSSWKLAYMIDMLLQIHGGGNDREAGFVIFFKNSKRNGIINTGFDVQVDGENWRFGSNTTIGMKNYPNVDCIMNIRLPPPNNDNHEFLITYHNNDEPRDIKYVAGYRAIKANRHYATDGSLLINKKNINAHIRLNWNDGKSASNQRIQMINNIFNATFQQNNIALKYALYTPKYIDQETTIISLNYDGSETSERCIFNTNIYYPSKNKIATAHISYESLNNINGTLNATTPIPRFSYATCDFIVLTTLKRNKRFIEVAWPNESALINSDYTYTSERLNSNLDGILNIEIPLSTRHLAQLNYGYKRRGETTTGLAKFNYNNNEILNGKYNSKGESRAGFEKEIIHIVIENPYQPLGIDYINKYEYSGGNGGTNYPTVESKWANIYRLDNSSAFNISGQSTITTNHEGQIIQLQATNFNKTVKLKADYKIMSGEFDHNCRLDLEEESAWATYRLNIVNKTTEYMDNQLIILDITYPWRNFTIDGSYRITSDEFYTDGGLSWNKTYPPGEESFEYETERKIAASLQWKNLSSNNSNTKYETINIKLKHPSLTKDATLAGYLNRQTDRALLNATIVADYSDDPDKLAWLTAIVQQEDNLPAHHIGYSYSIKGQHLKTRLYLDVAGRMKKESWYFFHTNHDALYSRSYLSEEKAKLYMLIDIPKHHVKCFNRKSNDIMKYLEVQYFPTHPIYQLNGSLIDTNKLLNATGSYYLNIPEKLTWLMVNYTPDAITSLRMYGYIPDARNAYFNIWRTYERDFLISDVSFYLKLNHSRLVTSTLKWRPNLKNDIIHNVRTTIHDYYQEMANDIVYWKKYIKSESITAINEIWDDAKDELHNYLSDWENLKEINDDLERLKIYCNNSYNSNDFYIKDLVAVGIYVLDELALRSHIESLPNILNEMWEIMGESGQAIRNSILWIIEATKTAYNKIGEIVAAILKGESISQIAHIIEKIVEKYDKFVKDLHVSFIKYVENLWNTFYLAINEQWDKTLKAIEPLFIRVLHYLEAVLWKASKEILDFLYDRRNELIKSPYFDRFTNFTQDVDKLYRDIKANDIITNIRKYTAIVISFLKERYFTMVPFGKELKSIIDEILSELGELKKLPTVHFTIEKIQYIYDRLNYFYEYFGINAKIENTIRIIHTKLVDVSQSALQAENKYREAKTKFIFDPNTGLMCLEQKLPMSWHAFNQTPEFQEIPEYRSLVDLRNYFKASNATFWMLYYRYKPFIDPTNWLPPFKAQAMLVGSHHYVTFDGYHYDFHKSGTYLLTKDFVTNDFALLVKHHDFNHKIIILCRHQTIEIDIIQNIVRFENSNDTLRLPMEFENGMGFIYQKESIVTVELKGGMIKLRCNLKYDVCTLELAGWYFGKIAGLLGTMNNERSDDTIQSNGIVTSDIDDFAKSWSLPQLEHVDDYINRTTDQNNQNNLDVELLIFCQNLFSNKSSEFGECFNIVEAAPYAQACINLKSKSYNDICTLAIGYMQMCGFYDTYLRIPDVCTSCPIIGGPSGITVPEGEFRKLEGPNIPISTDVVFIVEAKQCNADIKVNRSITTLINQMNKELNDYGIKNNRWALVAFGGDGVYDMPRSFIIDNEIFTQDVDKFIHYFDSIKIGNGNQDVFGAIAFASQLVFRAGVSKTFILMPCSHCESHNQSFDYSVINQVLLEHETTLHILMDGDFNFSKQRLNKIFYGLDATKSYTRKDVKTLSGDVDLRRQVKLSKSALGYCTPLALESNGTIFTGNKLRYETSNAVKKFSSVFAKRIALTALPTSCQHCECSADNDGVTHMDCLPCIYPLPASVDYVSETFNDDEILSVLQPVDADYGQVDGDED